MKTALQRAGMRGFNIVDGDGEAALGTPNLRISIKLVPRRLTDEDITAAQMRWLEENKPSPSPFTDALMSFGEYRSITVLTAIWFPWLSSGQK